MAGTTTAAVHIPRPLSYADVLARPAIPPGPFPDPAKHLFVQFVQELSDRVCSPEVVVGAAFLAEADLSIGPLERPDTR